MARADLPRGESLLSSSDNVAQIHEWRFAFMHGMTRFKSAEATAN